MHQGWRWFRAVVGAAALGGVGWVTGCGGTEADPPPETPGSGQCEDRSSEDCAPAQPSEPPVDGEEPPIEDETPDTPDGGTTDTEQQPTPEPPLPPPGPGGTVWLRREGTRQDDLALDAAVDASGDILTVAVHGLDDLEARHPTDNKVQLVLTRRSAAGEPRWTRTYEVRAPETPAELRASVHARLAMDPAGGILLAGTAEGQVDFETRQLGDGAFVARLDADGRLVWASTPRGEGLTVADLTVDSRGHALVAFNTTGAADFGGVHGSGAVVVTYTADGRAERVQAIGRPEGQDASVELTTLAVDGRGRLVVGGGFNGAVRFGKQQAWSARDGSPFLALYEGGALAWAKALSHTQGTVQQVGLDGQGTVVATGPFLGALAWAGTKLQGHPYRWSPFLLSTDASGQERWGRDLGDGLQAGSLAVEPSGGLVLAGFTYTLIEDGAAGQDGLGSAQPVALRYGRDGRPVQTRMFLSDPPEPRGELYGLEALPSVAVLPDGDAILFGHTDRDTDFGAGRRSTARGDVFLLRLKR